MNFLFSLLAALARMTGSVLNWGWQTLRPFMPWNWFGGGSVPAIPQKLNLPLVEDLKHEKDLMRGQQRTADLMMSEGPERQIKLYAGSHPDARHTVDLSRLEPVHELWLHSLASDALAMKALSEAPESKLRMLLQGHESVTNVPVPNAKGVPEKTQEMIPGFSLSDRIADFRYHKSKAESALAA